MPLILWAIQLNAISQKATTQVLYVCILRIDADHNSFCSVHVFLFLHMH